MNATFNCSGNIINSSINGVIIAKSYIAGQPSFKMRFCDQINVGGEQDYGIKVDDVSFHSCVNYQDFDFNKTLVMTPPNGTIEIMQYRITRDFNYPFKIYAFLTEKSNFKLEFTIKVKSPYKNFS
jgi:hypothetical protein